MVSKYTKIKINYKHLSKKYNEKIGKIIKIKTKSLTKGSHIKVECFCDKCGKKKKMMYKTYFKLINCDENNKYFCHKCAQQKANKTNLKKYGVKHPLQNKKILEKLKKTNLEKYGVDIVSKSNEFELKKQKTNLKKYGVKHVQQNKKK